MAAASIIPDESDREDRFNEAFCYLVGDDVPIKLDDETLGLLMTDVDGQAFVYKVCGKLAIIEHFDTAIATNLQPYKDILNTVIDANSGATVYDHLKASLV